MSLHKEKMISDHWPLIDVVVGGDQKAAGREGRIGGGQPLLRGERLLIKTCEKYDTFGLSGMVY